MSEKSEFLGTCFRAATLAGQCILKNLGSVSASEITTKQASDFVTHVDRESEELIKNTIKNDFPDHRILAEESDKDASDGTYRWIIDPLDGTTNFIHGYPVFSVSIALESKGDIILGVIFDPLRNEIFSAEKGKGAYLNGKPISVSTIKDLTFSLIATGFPFRQKDVIDDYLKLFKNIFYRVSDIRRAGSAALDLANLASGRCDGFFEIGLSPWDIAAGSIIIREAGGIVSDFGGSDQFLKTGNVVAANRELHDALLTEVRTVFHKTLNN